MSKHSVSGEQLFALRAREPAANGQYHAGLFEGKKRTYVYQIQGRFKRQPRGPLYFQASATDDKAYLGMLTRGVISTWASFAEPYVPGMKLQMDPEPSCPIGASLAVDPSWIAILKTPHGEIPHPLGTSLPPYAECVAYNGCDVGSLSEVDLDATYTMEYYTSYCDFIEYSLSIPLVDVSLSRLFPYCAAVPGSTGIACFFHEEYDAAKGHGFLVPPPADSTMCGAMFVHTG